MRKDKTNSEFKWNFIKIDTTILKEGCSLEIWVGLSPTFVNKLISYFYLK